jgi:hypothetical protein
MKGGPPGTAFSAFLSVKLSSDATSRLCGEKYEAKNTV